VSQKKKTDGGTESRKAAYAALKEADKQRKGVGAATEDLREEINSGQKIDRRLYGSGSGVA